MISPFIYHKIKKSAKDKNLTIPQNYEEILQRYKSIGKVDKRLIVFSWAMDAGENVLNASPKMPGCVLLNSAWAARVVLYDNEDTINAFKITVGHELTHKDKEVRELLHLKINRKFIARVSEVHADFGAAQKMFCSNRNALLASIDYKKLLKKVDNEDFRHPTWQRRKEYVLNYDFNEELIRIIANDVNCHNEKLIKRVVNFYDEIILN